MHDPREAFGKLHDIVTRLRGPDGCPWDREQTPASLRANLIEEAYECVEAVNEADPAHIQEELGDLYLLATMYAVIYEEQGSFSTADALETVSEKLVRRHPHVFGDATADTPDAVVTQWNDIKEQLEGRRRKDSVLDGVSRALPPLERAWKLQKAAAKAGFDWPDSSGPWDKLAEEIAEARLACATLEDNASGTTPMPVATVPAGTPEATVRQALEDEIGDILFSVINVARHHQVDPALALHRTAEKFARRFRHVERRMRDSGQAMEPGKLAIMDGFWDEAKHAESHMPSEPA
jgi:tetrapyrrole methylase family protein/MazG family protein